eukprot:2573280-Pleurochrysis_carterae.AAC.1
MHSSANWVCAACVLLEPFALRSPSSWISLAHGHRRPVCAFSSNRRTGAPQPPHLRRSPTDGH